MFGVVNFIRSLVFVALALGATGTLVEATGFVGREDAKAHQLGCDSRMKIATVSSAKTTNRRPEVERHKQRDVLRYRMSL